MAELPSGSVKMYPCIARKNKFCMTLSAPCKYLIPSCETLFAMHCCVCMNMHLVHLCMYGHASGAYYVYSGKHERALKSREYYLTFS